MVDDLWLFADDTVDISELPSQLHFKHTFLVVSYRRLPRRQAAARAESRLPCSMLREEQVRYKHASQLLSLKQYLRNIGLRPPYLLLRARSSSANK